MMQLDERDIKILSILQSDGRITKSALAESVHLSPTACWERLQRLEKAGIINGYGANINPAKLGDYIVVFMEASLKSHEIHDFQRFENAIKKIDAIAECWAVGGGIDYFLKVVASSINEYQRVVDEMLTSDIGLNRYYTYVVTKSIKESDSIPEALLRRI